MALDIAQLIANKYQDKHPKSSPIFRGRSGVYLHFFWLSGYPSAQGPDYQLIL